jgi:hypothetical protein
MKNYLLEDVVYYRRTNYLKATLAKRATIGPYKGVAMMTAGCTLLLF